MSSPLPTVTQWPEISPLLDELLALTAADRVPWLEQLATAHPLYLDALRELLATLERMEARDFLGALPRLDIDADAAPPCTRRPAG